MLLRTVVTRAYEKLVNLGNLETLRPFCVTVCVSVCVSVVFEQLAWTRTSSRTMELCPAERPTLSCVKVHGQTGPWDTCWAHHMLCSWALGSRPIAAASAVHKVLLNTRPWSYERSVTTEVVRPDSAFQSTNSGISLCELTGRCCCPALSQISSLLSRLPPQVFTGKMWTMSMSNTQIQSMRVAFICL
jgi:hypothetical protein